MNIFPIVLLVPLLLSCATTQRSPESPPNESSNPFFADRFSTPHGAPPFERITAAHFAPAFDEAMRQHQSEIDKIARNPDSPTFANTIEELERAGSMLSRIARVFFNRTSAYTSPEVQEIQNTYAPRLSNHQDSIAQNDALFSRVEALREQKSDLKLDTQQDKLLEDIYRRFVRAGAKLSTKKKARLTKINARLAGLHTTFGNHVREENEAYALEITDKNDLVGLPAAVVAAAAETAQSRGKEGKWVFTLVRSSIEPFLQYADKRALRQQIYQAYISRGAHGDARDNRSLIKEILLLRAERANLLGYATFAHYMIANNMAKTPEAVYDLLRQLWKGALAKAKRERKDLAALLRNDLGDEARLEPWDWRYYAEKVRLAQYAVSQEELRPYFQVDAVRQGAFDTATRLFGVRFKEVTDQVPVYHSDVKAFEVTNKDGSLVGLYYVDYPARDGKRGGAWMSAFRSQSKLDGPVRPIIVNVGNFPPSIDGKPALLAWNEVQTLFHEFGHGLHGLLSDVTYEGQSGTSVKRDYVEMPSQILENWGAHPKVIKSYALHHETGAVIPDELIAKIEKAKTFNQGFMMTELVAAALLDMKWHTLTLEELRKIDDVALFDKEAMQEIGLIREIAPRYHSPYFSHIFSGEGYSAGYYVYLWAQVLEADAFKAFTDVGDVFDPTLAEKLRRYIFAAGGSDDEMKLYRAFRGKDPTVEPLLHKLGMGSK